MLLAAGTLRAQATPPDEQARGLLEDGPTYRREGKLKQALDNFNTIVSRLANTDSVDDALLEIGHALALMGEPRPAMEEFQRIRSRFPTSEWAPKALDRITALYRLYGGAKPVFALDPAFTAGSGDVLKGVRAILMTPARVLWIASDKVKGVVPVGPDGKLGASLHGADLHSLSLRPSGDLVVAARLAVRV